MEIDPLLLPKQHCRSLYLFRAGGRVITGSFDLLLVGYTTSSWFYIPHGILFVQMNEQNDIKRFLANTKCGRCGQHPGLDNINLVGRLVDLLLFIVYCPSCNKTALAVVNHIGYIGDKESETATDLTEAEESHFSVPIGSSDILNMYSFLKDFNGDFTSLFSK